MLAARRECGCRCELEDKTTLLEVRGSSVFDVLNFHIYAVHRSRIDNRLRPLRFSRKFPTRKKAAAALVKRGAMCPRRRRLRSARDELHRHALAVCRGGGETSGLSATQSGY